MNHNIRPIAPPNDRTEALETEVEEVYRSITELTNELEEQIEAHKQTSEKLHASEGRIRAITKNLLDIIYIVDGDGRVSYIGPSITRLAGYTHEELLGRKAGDLLHADDVALVTRVYAEALANPQTNLKVPDHRLRRKNGDWLFLEGSATGMPDEPGVEGVVVSCHDVTDRRQHEDIIRRQANYDSLTGLPNRILFRDRLQQAIDAAERHGDKVALMFIDLDGFKKVNDRLGHDVGDELLILTGQRLRDCVGEADTVARLGGDEFTVILPELQKNGDADLIARKILDKLAEPYRIGSNEVYVTGSIGITVFPGDAKDFDGLVRHADTAMYESKASGRNRVHFFTEKMNLQAVERLALESDLRSAISGDQLQIHFQPIVQLDNWQMIGAEALLRWKHPERGMILPDSFIPAAEESGLIVSLGEWVMRRVCEVMQTCRDTGHALDHLAVNFSPRECREPGFAEKINATLQEFDIDPSAISVEVTENILIDSDGAESVDAIQNLRGLGASISLDDFGTGYSSLSYLTKLPIDVLKIDRSFVSALDGSTENHTLVNTIIAMARGLGMKVIAEGIETPAQFQYLRDAGCDYGQGYFIGKPLPLDLLEDWLREHMAANEIDFV